MSKYANLYPAISEMNLGVIRAAWPTTAYQIKAAALTANWLLARGAPLVLDGGHVWPEGGAQTRALNYRYHTTGVNTMVAAAICVSMETAGEGVESMPVAIDTLSLLIGTNPGVIQIAYPHPVAAEWDWELTFAWDGSVGVLHVHSIILYECPAVFIEPTGVNIIERGDMIFDGASIQQSIAGLEKVTEELRTDYFRRGALFNWATGYTGGVTNNTTSYVALHGNGIKPAIQTRFMYSGDVTRSCSISVMAYVSGGTGNVRITMTNGATITFNITNTGTPAWKTTQQIAVWTDDPTLWDSGGGIRGGTRDEITIEYRAASGNFIFLFAVSIWDPPGD